MTARTHRTAPCLSRTSVALLACGALALAGARPARGQVSAGSTQQQVARHWVTNLETSSFLSPEIDGRWLAFVVSEAQEGAQDLNGDGDANDYVMHVRDRATGAAQNLGLATFVFALEGQHVVFLVDEASQGGLDLNGDGDAFDQVAHVHAAATGSTTNLGLTAAPETFGAQIGGGLVTLGVDETAQGADLNGDGDTFDLVLHVHDVASGITTNLALATPFSVVGLGDGRVAFLVSEYDQGPADLNGDGDVFDVVLHVFESSSGTTTNTGLAVSYDAPRLAGPLVLVEVPEAAHGNADLNGDGDSSDRVAFLFDTSGGQATNLGLAASYASSQIAGNFVVVSVDESDQGNTDLNGDGDVLDYVDHVYDLTTGTTTGLGLASAGFLYDGGIVVFRVWESGQGFTDLNGDGDTSDVVLHVHELATALTTNLAVAAEFDVRLAGNLAAFRVAELAQAGADLNGDGDLGDTVVHVFDGATGVLTNLGLGQSANGIQVHAGRVAFDVDEASQGGTSLNGDEDALDDVLHVYDSSSGATLNLRLAVEDFRLSRRLLTFEVSESDQGEDLNGDLDQVDDVVHLVRRL